MTKAILLIGEDPAESDFDAPGAPRGLTAEKMMAGLDGAIDRLEAAGYTADLLLTKDGPRSRRKRETRLRSATTT